MSQKVSKSALWKSWHQNPRKLKKCTSDDENIKKWANKCQKVHLGNPDAKIIESGQKCTSDDENIKKWAKKCQKVHFWNPKP